jgi:hypothetical protein
VFRTLFLLRLANSCTDTSVRVIPSSRIPIYRTSLLQRRKSALRCSLLLGASVTSRNHCSTAIVRTCFNVCLPHFGTAHTRK